MLTIRDRRLARLLWLRDHRFGGNQSALANAISRSQAQVSQWVQGVRTITEESARMIERALRLPPTWLDAKDDEEAARLPAPELNNAERTLVEHFRALPRERKSDLLLLAERWRHMAELAIDARKAADQAAAPPPAAQQKASR